MRTLTAIVAGLILTPLTTFAQVEPEAKQALEKMVEAVNNAKTISFHVEINGVGKWFSMLPTTKGDVVAARPEDGEKVWKMRVAGKSEGTGIEAMDILVVSDGKKRTWVDHQAKQVMERVIGQDRGNVIDNASTIMLRDLVFGAQPISKELTCPTIKAEPAVELDGVKCDVIYADQGENLPKSRWSIATTDHMPRKYEYIVKGGGMDDSQVWTLTKVKVNAEPPVGSFAISTPDGYTFSPAVAPTPPPQATPVAATPAKRERPVGPNIDDLAPDFELATPSGEKVKLSSARGGVAVVDFFGTWSPQCKKYTPEVQKLVDAFKDKPVKFYGLSVREASDTNPANFFKDNKLTYTLLVKGDEAAKQFRVKKYPTLFVIGLEGEIVGVFAGYDDKSGPDITAKINQALAGPPKVVDPTGSAAPRTKAQPGAKPDAPKNDGDVPPKDDK